MVAGMLAYIPSALDEFTPYDGAIFGNALAANAPLSGGDSYESRLKRGMWASKTAAEA